MPSLLIYLILKADLQVFINDVNGVVFQPVEQGQIPKKSKILEALQKPDPEPEAPVYSLSVCIALCCLILLPPATDCQLII